MDFWVVDAVIALGLKNVALDLRWIDMAPGNKQSLTVKKKRRSFGQVAYAMPCRVHDIGSTPTAHTFGRIMMLLLLKLHFSFVIMKVILQTWHEGCR